MERKEAFEIVLEELKRCSLFKGVYDAKNGNSQFMYGISTVMENIAYSISDEVGDAFSEEFGDNLYESQKKAGVI